jgi:KDO2-lipid IV(A) lauroyltransferase
MSRAEGNAPAGRFPFFHAGSGYAFGAFVGRLVPRSVAQFIGGSISLLYARLQPERVTIVQRNLALIEPDGVSPELARSVFRDFGRTMGDYFHLAGRSAEDALKLVSEHIGFEHFETVRQLGRGGLLLTPHLSFFELGGAAAHANGFNIVALTAPESTPALTAWRAAYRARWGVETVEIGSGEDQFIFLEVARHLDAGRFVAALVDRPNSSKTSPVTLPGGSAEFSGAILLLAMARQCPVLPVTTERLADGTYRVEAHEPFFVERGERGDTAAMLQRNCQRLADVFAPVIRRCPSQWFHFVPLTRPTVATAGDS